MSAYIAVCGSGASDKNISPDQRRLAFELGKSIALHEGVLLTGGRGGIMEAVCRGAKEQNGQTIGILPSSSTPANAFVDIALPTGLGAYRNMALIHMADVVIALTGKWGTLQEICTAMIIGKPLVFLKGSNGFVDMLLSSGFLQEAITPYVITESPQEAVEKAVALISDDSKISKD